MDITGISFNPPAASQPDKMKALIDGLCMKNWGPNGKEVNFPLRSMEQILEHLANNRGSEVSIIEWIYLFDNKDGWDDLKSEDEVNQTSVNIIKAIVNDPNLIHLTLFRVALSIENEDSHFPKILIDNLNLLEKYMSSEREKDAIRILVAASHGTYFPIATMSLNAGVTPGELLISTGLARCTNLYRDICFALIDLTTEIKLPKHENWLVNSIGELSNKVRVEFLNSLIPKIRNLKESNKFISWLSEYCHPSIENSIWFNLNVDTKKILRTYIEISDFCNVEHLVRLILSKHVIEELNIDEATKKQIRSRDIYWSHYQDSIVSIRVIVPKTTAKAISNISTQPEWLEIFEDNNASTEIVIFEFSNHIIVEFLRGRSSEVRVFKNNSRNVNLLLKQKSIRLDTIRKLFENGVHDHVFLWQWACEKWLRENYKILPDSHITKFKGLPPSASTYRQLSGLPTPKLDLLLERKKQLESWNSYFFQDEKIVKKGQVDSLEMRMWTVKARQDKDHGDYKSMCKHLELAAKLGDMNAAYRLAKWLLTKGGATETERVLGEYWLKISNIYKGEENLSKKDIIAWQKRLNKNWKGKYIKRQVFRLIKTSHIGVKYLNRVYPLCLEKDLAYTIYLNDEHYSLDECPEISDTKGLFITLNE
jgi:hypothetical protein